MTTREAFRHFTSRLTSLYAAREAHQIAQMVFEQVTGFTRLDLVTRSDAAVSKSQQDTLDKKLELLGEGMPVQYVIGEAWFCRLKLHVDNHVLIPRPETEELVAWILEDLKAWEPHSLPDAAEPPVILDVGTGSGCIAIALKKNLPSFRVMALDKSKQAVKTAEKNAAMHGTDVSFIQADVLRPAACPLLPAIEVLVSNPPYIPGSEKKALQPQVARYEPSHALFVPDNDPLVFYKAILEMAVEKLADNGRIYTEIHEDFGQETLALFRRYGFKEATLRKDMNGHDRMIRGIKMH